MANKLLDDLLNFRTSSDDLINWLTSDDFNSVRWMKFNSACTREEFISFFLNYLRDQFGSVLETAASGCKTPAKKVLSFINKTVESAKADKESAQNTSPSQQKDVPAESTSCSSDSLQENKSALPINSSFDSNNKNTSTPIKHNLSENRFSEVQQNVANCSPTGWANWCSSVPKNSAPIPKNKMTLPRKKIELKSCSPTQIGNINPSFKECPERDQNNSLQYKNNSIYNESFPSLERNNSSTLSAFNTPTKNESSEFSYANHSQKSNSSTNRIIQSPMSPLYSNSFVSPVQIKAQNRYNSNQTGDSPFHQNLTSTPERTFNTPKNSKVTPRQNVSLGDFIVTESRSSKKGSGKKGKISSRSVEQIDSSLNILSDTSSTYSENNTRRRRKVNPTPLNAENNEGSKENRAFGDVSRPFTQNPQFVNVSPIDKSVDNESFQVERGLIKIERQKKPDAVKEKVDANENSTVEQNLPRFKLLTRTPQKVLQSKSIIIPNKLLVENIEVLDVLAELYSRFLDHNLIINPMTELYFIIHLITVQYFTNNDELSSALTNFEEKEESSILEKNDSVCIAKKNLAVLRRSLKFDNFSDENSVNNKVERFTEVDTHQNGSLDDINYSNIENSETKSSNVVNEKLKMMLISDKIENAQEANNSIGAKVTKNNKTWYLGTPHNCVYFSTQVLKHQKAFVKCLDRVTLKLLCENNQISVFQPELCSYLNSIYDSKVLESNKMKSVLNIGVVDLNVCFQIDTDNREKFPSSTAFTAFRKQRDMFYEILKIWEDNHLVPGWSFQIALGGKIKNILSMHVDVINLTHFSRLFTSQMLISCIQSGHQDDLLNDETTSFLKNLKDNNPEKFTQLQKKFITPSSQNGPVPLPSFPGIQEFYKDFIFHSNQPMFHTYLENTFVHEIMELNNSQFVNSDIEDRDTEVDEQTKQNFIACLSSLRLLAKFLGYITSLPYKSETSMLENVIASQVTLRSECLPRIDLQYCLQTALIAGKLSLTVPWVVEYLAMMDHASLRLPYYKKVLEMLYCIYRASRYHTTTKSEELMSQKTAILIKLAIGWLFELPVFPKELYYNWQSKYNNKSLKMICEAPQSVNKIECDSLTDADTSLVSVKHSLFLDKFEMVDDRVLYNCCPFLRELNILLTPGNPSVNSSTTYKHVTPVTSQLQKSNTRKATAKHLEIQLEEAFFHGQPMSTRKTVEYVAERVASSCVKYICNNLLTVERKKTNEALKEIIHKKCGDILEKGSESLKNALLKDMNVLSAKAVESTKMKSAEVIPKMCESRVTQAIASLLSEDCLDSVKNICTKIAIRMSMDRIDQWIRSHIVGSSIFMKDMELELKSYKSINEPVVDKKSHNPSALSPTDIIQEMRKLIWDLLEGRPLSLDVIDKFWDQLYVCLTERSDLKSTSEKIIAALSVDLCLFLITFRNDIFTNEVQEKAIKVWKIDHLKFSDSDSPLSRILSPRNIQLILKASNDNVWINCGNFLKKLLKENILSIDMLSGQAVAVFRDEWPSPTMKNLSICLKQAIDDYKSMDEETEKIRYLVDWVAGAYNDMDQDSFSFM